MTILKAENVKFESKVLPELIMRYFPDWRRVLNELQRYAASGQIDTGILSNLSNTSFQSLIASLKAKDFSSMRKWVAENIDNDSTSLFRNFYNNAVEVLQPNSVPQMVLLLADYQYKAAFVADQEINLAAFLTEVMAGCEFK
jgi:DNA polymerase III delta prime subunit